MLLRESYPDSESPEDDFYNDSVLWKDTATFYKLKPKELTLYQKEILSIFYKCRQESEELKTIPNAILKEYCNSKASDFDIVKFIVKGLDTHFLKACSDKMKRDLEKSKNKAAK